MSRKVGNQSIVDNAVSDYCGLRGDVEWRDEDMTRHVTSVVDQVVHAGAACAVSGGRSGRVRDVARILTLIRRGDERR